MEELNTEVAVEPVVDTPAADIAPAIEETEPLSRREAIAAAFEEGTEEKVEAVNPDKPVAASVAKDDPVERAPSSWKTTTKAKWATVDPEVRQEVIRREREAAQVLTTSDNARRFTNDMSQVLGPHSARLQSLGVQPAKAVELLLQTDAILSQGAPAARAQRMAKLITDYGVDLKLLDEVLAGMPVSQENPMLDRVAQMLDQRLAPVNQFLTTQQRSVQQADQQETQRVMQEVDAMEANVEKYPFFHRVRTEMADLVEVKAKQGVSISLDQAYNRCVMADDALSAEMVARKSADASRVAAEARNAQARRALGASRSVAGSATGSPGTVVAASDRRGTIAAAFEALGGR